jgi:hypothetical protein
MPSAIIRYHLRLDRDILTEACEASELSSAAVCNATSFIEYRGFCDISHAAGIMFLICLDQLGASLKRLLSYALIFFTFPHDH